MTLEEELKQEILNKYRSVRAFTTAINIPYSTLDSVFKRGISNAGVETMVKVFTTLGLDLESIQDGHLRPSDIKKSPSLPDEALKVAHDYNDLDTHGKSMTRLVITEEQRRMDEEKKAAELRRREKELVLMDEELGEPVESRVIPLYLTAAAAGYTAPVFGEDFDYIEVGGDVPRHADFAVKIDGDSMEPYIMDGSTVYVNRDPLADGDVGIFCLDGDMLCKQYHKDAHGVVRLLSLNRERSDADRLVREGSTLACFGRVILPHQPRVVI